MTSFINNKIFHNRNPGVIRIVHSEKAMMLTGHQQQKVCVVARRADGVDVDQKMLALSTYMGHAEIFYTYWYLTAVPELMAITAGRF